VGLSFAKGKAAAEGPAKDYLIDGLSGATITTQGVDKLMEFWFGEHGFKTFFEKLRQAQPTGATVPKSSLPGGDIHG
jgi:Na+-transporting NADH:ubiquinone oxidoreductase subunit C